VAIRSFIRNSTQRFAQSPRRNALALAALFLGTGAPVAAAPAAHAPAFAITIDPQLRSTPLTGRVFIFVTRDGRTEPRLQYNGLADSIPFFGRDVAQLAPGATTMLAPATEGYPVATIADLPPGDYTVQALADVYTRFPRADGHTIWAHADAGEGQLFTISPGNLISVPQRIHIAARGAQTFALRLTRAIPPIAPPADTAWVKHVRIRSALLSRFWGVPTYIGATVLLPRDYATQTQTRYATVYEQGHFSRAAPFGFNPDRKPETPEQRAERASRTERESSYEFTQAWMHGDVPPLVAVTFQHATPYYDDSYAVDSANSGPYGTALTTELIPYLEAHFRLIPDGRHRFLIGGSTGGWEALALQIYHPALFNGAWGLYPDPVDFHRFQIGDMYADRSAFATTRTAWISSEIPAQRDRDGNTVATMREESRLEFVLGSHGRSGEQFNAWDASYGPVGADGYPAEMWDKHTGMIHHDVIDAMNRAGFDLEAYLERNWSRIGTQLAGKITIDVGDADDYFLNLACYRLQTFLDAQTAPPAQATFAYGRPLKPHGYQAHTDMYYLREMAQRAGP
jgi:hypothetical protein